VAAKLAKNRRAGERSEGNASLGVEPLQRGNEPEAGYLDQIVAGLDAAAVSHGETAREREKAADDLLARVLVASQGVLGEQILLGLERV
jgi:hypothetical protein